MQWCWKARETNEIHIKYGFRSDILLPEKYSETLSCVPPARIQDEAHTTFLPVYNEMQRCALHTQHIWECVYLRVCVFVPGRNRNCNVSNWQQQNLNKHCHKMQPNPSSRHQHQLQYQHQWSSVAKRVALDSSWFCGVGLGWVESTHPIVGLSIKLPTATRLEGLSWAVVCVLPIGN